MKHLIKKLHAAYLLIIVLAISATWMPKVWLRACALLGLVLILGISLRQHHRRAKLKKDVLIEYIITAAAVLVILAGTY
jgi:ABC-type uncharacterized transport system permease subunit